jgi:hypothetical protein
MTPLNDRLVFLIIGICVVVCLLGPSVISLSERKNFNRLVDKLSFVSIPKTGPTGATQYPMFPAQHPVAGVSHLPAANARGADFIRQNAKSFDLIFTSHYSWYHPFVEYFTGSIWTHAAL